MEVLLSKIKLGEYRSHRDIVVDGVREKMIE